MTSLRYSDSVPEDSNIPEGHVVEIQGKKVKGVGLGNIFGDGPIKLRSTGRGVDPGPAPVPAKKETAAVKPQHHPKVESPPVETQKVTFFH